MSGRQDRSVEGAAKCWVHGEMTTIPLVAAEYASSAMAVDRAWHWSVPFEGAWPTDILSRATAILPVLHVPVPSTSCTQRHTLLIEQSLDPAIRIAYLLHDLPDREPSLVEPHSSLGIFRGDAVCPQCHALTPEQLAKPTPRDAILPAERPNCLSRGISRHQFLDSLKIKAPPKAPRRDSSGLDESRH